VTGYRLGVDFGTSNTVAVLGWPDGRVRPLLFDGVPLLSSAVYADSGGRMLVGREADRSARMDPARYEPNPKRRIDDLEVLLGDGIYPVAELFAAVLGRVATEAVRTAGEPPGSVTLTCPAAWGPARRKVLTAAATAAGLPGAQVLPEPVAAAAYLVAIGKQPVPIGGCVVVYDLGGGTFDASVVRRTPSSFETLAYRGLDDFGGVDLDALVVDAIGGVLARSAPEAWLRVTRPTTPGDRRQFLQL
jgi:molecular chaperone DnaK